MSHLVISSKRGATHLVRRPIHRLLSGGDCVHGCHQTLFDAKVVVDHFGQGCQAVGGAAGVGDYDVTATVILVMVHPHHKHGGVG